MSHLKVKIKRPVFQKKSTKKKRTESLRGKFFKITQQRGPALPNKVRGQYFSSQKTMSNYFQNKILKKLILKILK